MSTVKTPTPPRAPSPPPPPPPLEDPPISPPSGTCSGRPPTPTPSAPPSSAGLSSLREDGFRKPLSFFPKPETIPEEAKDHDKEIAKLKAGLHTLARSNDALTAVIGEAMGHLVVEQPNQMLQGMMMCFTTLQAAGVAPVKGGVTIKELPPLATKADIEKAMLAAKIKQLKLLRKGKK